MMVKSQRPVYSKAKKGKKEIRTSDLLKFVVSIVICQLAGFVGAYFNTPAIPTWYNTLKKPYFTPPNSVFSPVWIALFFLMGISLYLVWRDPFKLQTKKSAIILFAIQLALNIFWSIIFFGLRAPFEAFIEIIVLWLAILLTIIVFFRVSKLAGVLMIPYLLWVSFAAVLNFFLWKLNL